MSDAQVPHQSDPIRRRGAVAVVVRDARFLVIRRSSRVVAPGACCFPGGGIEAGESEIRALVREFREELSAEIRRVWKSITRWHVELAWWLGELDPKIELLPNPAEVESVHWLTREEMLAHPNLLDSNVAFLRALAAGEIVIE